MKRPSSLFPKIVVGMVIVIVILAVAGNFLLFKECMNDGNKLYQCYAMLNKPRAVYLDIEDHRGRLSNSY